MSAVKDRCLELQEKLRQLSGVRKTEAAAEKLEARRSELAEERTRLVATAASTEVLLRNDHLAGAELPDCEKALESCDKIAAILGETTGEAPLTKGNEYRYLLSRVRKVSLSLASLNERTWQGVLEEHQTVDEAFLQKMELFPGQEHTVRTIRALKGNYDAAAAGVPINEAAYERFTACHAALQEQISSLPRKAFPDDVVEFLRGATQPAGAPLALLTDDVQAWLEENDLLPGVRVRFVGTGRS